MSNTNKHLVFKLNAVVKILLLALLTGCNEQEIRQFKEVMEVIPPICMEGSTCNYVTVSNAKNVCIADRGSNCWQGSDGQRYNYCQQRGDLYVCH